MRIESLILFLSVVEQGSISRAARQFYLSQQGASSAIKALEHDFGVSLFDRASGMLQLTEEGRRFAQEAVAVVNAYRRLQTAMTLAGATEGECDGPVRIVTTPHASHVLAPIFDAYRDASGLDDPFVFIEKSIFDIVREYPALDGDALHLVNVPTFTKSIIAKLGPSFEPLVAADLMLYCAADCPFASRAVVERADLAGARIACYNEALLIKLVRHLLKEVDGAGIYMQTSNLQMLGHIIAHQRMVSFTDSLSCFLSGIRSGEAVVPIEGTVSFATGILGPVPPAAQRFAAFFRRYLGTVCARYMERYPLAWPPGSEGEGAA